MMQNILLLRVSDLVGKYKDSSVLNELMTAALLHDVLEDGHTTKANLEERFGNLVADLVEELTTDKELLQIAGGKEKYLAEKMNHMSSWALVIKLSDRLDNVSDFDIAPEKFVKKYVDETVYILEELMKHRELSGTQLTIIDLIWDKLEKYL